MSTGGRNDAARWRARLAGNAAVAGGWRLLRIEQADLSQALRPGQRVAVPVADGRIEGYVSHAQADWFALLLPPTAAAARLPVHAALEVEGPLGSGWPASSGRPAVVLASGPIIAAALFLAQRLAPQPRLVLLGSGGLPLPFRPVPSAFLVGGLPPPVIAAAPVLEDRGIPSRIAAPDGRPGCFEGSATELFRLWRAAHPADALDVFAGLADEEVATLAQPGLRVQPLDQSR